MKNSGFDVALIQVCVSDGESGESRLGRATSLLDRLDHPVQLAILPELWTVGFFNFAGYEHAAEPLGGSLCSQLSEVSRKLKLWLHGGSMIERGADGNLYNTSVLFAPDGSLAASYRKVHLFGFQSREKELLKPGSCAQSAQTELGCFGLTTCYDLRFPELYRALMSQGVEIFLTASAWPVPRLEHWLTLNRARAIENLSYVVSCNAAGTNCGQTYLGTSLVIDPWGTVVARGAADSKQVLYARVELDRVWEARSRFPALTDIRPVASSRGQG